MSPRYFLHTFGCQMNHHDSDRMAEILDSQGFVRADGIDDADLAIFNTCSVREKAEHKLRSELGKLKIWKDERPGRVLAATGCVAQQEGDALLKRIKNLDLVLGPDNLAELPGLFHQAVAGALPVARTVFDLDAPTFLSASPVAFGRGKGAPVSAFVTTMKGCDERCSFCIVPTTRGSERYRPAREILDEITALVDAGTREVVLLGQTVDSYRDDSLPPPEAVDPDESQFPHLLRAIAHRVPKLARLRYTSPHPRHLTPSLCRAHAELDVLARHVHMPAQSGSNRILKRMIRRTTREEYVARVTRLREARPGLTLSTDLIVGFPGESREDFEATLSLVREVGFVSLFAFKYSPRPGTPALKLGDDVTEAEKSARLAELFAVSEGLTRAHLQTLAGTRQHVLVEGPGKIPGNLTGRTAQNEIVHFADVPDVDLLGQILAVQVTEAFKHSLLAELVPGQLESLPKRPARAPARRALAVITP